MGRIGGRSLRLIDTDIRSREERYRGQTDGTSAPGSHAHSFNHAYTPGQAQLHGNYGDQGKTSRYKEDSRQVEKYQRRETRKADDDVGLRSSNRLNIS